MAGYKRRRQANDADEDEAPAGYAQVLPVATLPADFDGEAEDGATYLALASRHNAALPSVTRVNPRRSKTPVPAPLPAPLPAAPRPRHPVLPRESWVVVFGAHFGAYRRSLAERFAACAPAPAAPVVPVVVQVDEEEAANEEEASNGHGEGEEEDQGEGEEKQEDLPAAYDHDGWIAYVDNIDEVDEEEAMNGITAGPPREPLVGLLRRLDTHTTLALLTHLIPSTSLPPHRARWLFALLATLEPQLDRDHVSTLRSFAREIIAFICTQYAAAYERKQLAAVPVFPGFYSGDNSVDPETEGVKLEPKWALGAAWKRDMDARPRSEVMRPEREGGAGQGGAEGGAGDALVDAEIARAWMAVFAVISGWAQHDLVDEAEGAVRRLPV